jgi:putative CRISPR-associated protein (TIGR02619 family)
MRTILTTVGTSLLGNAGRALARADLTERDLADHLTDTDAVRASAETNAISRLLQTDDRIVFLHSHTDDGRRCAEALQRYYDRRGHHAESIEVRDLSYVESRFKLQGLRALVAALAERIGWERAQGRTVVINATGGFKAEIAYATLVGLLFDVPVYYIHELFNDLIEMPPVPVAWDYAVLAEWEEFFDWIDAEPRATVDVDRYRPSPPQEVRMLLKDDGDGCTYLSPAGEAYFRAYRYALERSTGVPVYLSAVAQRTYAQAEAAVRAVWDRAMQKLRSPELRRSHSDRAGEGDCLVFPKGRRPERVFWFEDDGAVYVCELARHNDQSYERLLERGVRRRNYPSTDFRAWSP